MKKIFFTYVCIMCAYATYSQDVRMPEFVWDSLTHCLSINDSAHTPVAQITFPLECDWDATDASISFNPMKTCSRIFTIRAYADSKMNFSWLPCISKTKAVWDKKTPLKRYRDWHYLDINVVESSSIASAYIHDPEWLTLPLGKNTVYKLITTWNNGYEICSEVKIKISLSP